MHRRVTFLPALSATECGPACLAMVLHYFGGRIKVREVADACCVGRAGVSASALVATGRQYGLSMKALAASLNDLGPMPKPVILHWDFNHWVVLERWAKRDAIIVDPAAGRLAVDVQEISNRFTGIVLTAAPTENFVRRHDKSLALRRFFTESVRKARFYPVLAAALGAALLGQLLALCLTLFTKILIDNILPAHRHNFIYLVGFLGLVIMLGRLLCGYLRSATLTKVRSRLDTEFMMGLVEHLFFLPFRFFQERTAGDLLNRLASYSNLRIALGDQALATFVDGLFAIIYLSAAIYIDIRVLPLILGLGMIEVLLLLVRFGNDSALSRTEVVAEQRHQSVLVDALRGIQYVKASGIEDFIMAKWRPFFVRQMETRASRSYRNSFLDAAIEGINLSISPLVLWYGSLEVLAGRMSLGAVFMVVLLVSAFVTPLQAVVGRLQQLQHSFAYLDRLDDILACSREIAPVTGFSHVLKGEIEVRNLTFSYPGESKPSLIDISFQITPGGKTVVVGQTGAGKSTLLLLLLGLYKPTSGSILFDGIPLEQLGSENLRSQIGVVLQDDVLFEGTILSNLLAGRRGSDVKDVIRAAKIAGIHEMIEQWPAGYETHVSEAGRNLSGGQRQRLALARALLGNPRILIMDEPTSHLDLETESAIEQALNNLHCTRIVATHRPWATAGANCVLGLRNGRLLKYEMSSSTPASNPHLQFGNVIGPARGNTSPMG